VGGNTTCLELATGTNDRIIIDAGTGMRQLGQKIAKEPLTPNLHLLLTHSHWDHLAGFTFFTPAFSPRFTLAVYGNMMAQDVIKKDIYERRDNRYYPVNMDVLRAQCKFNSVLPDPLIIADIHITILSLNHPGNGFAYRFVQNGKTIAFITDNELGILYHGGHTHKQLIDFIRDADIFIHDAQYLPEELPEHKGWGHSAYNEVLDVAALAGCKKVYLTHHDPERNDDQCDSLLNDARLYADDKNYKLECYLATEGLTLAL